MSNADATRPRRGRPFEPAYEAPVGTAEYAAEQRRYHALAGQFRILAYTTSPTLLLEREAWLWPQLWAVARDRRHDQGPLSTTPRAIAGRNQREGTRLQYLRLSKVLEDLAQHPTAGDFPQAERDAWQHIWIVARERGWLADNPENESRETDGNA